MTSIRGRNKKEPPFEPSLPLPDDVGMDPARYSVHVEAHRANGTGTGTGTGYTLLRVGPYFQTWVASHDADHLNTELVGRAATVIPGFAVTAKDALFDVSDHESYTGPYLADVTALLTDALAGASMCPPQLPRPHTRRPGTPRSAGCRAFLRFKGQPGHFHA